MIFVTLQFIDRNLLTLKKNVCMYFSMCCHTQVCVCAHTINVPVTMHN